MSRHNLEEKKGTKNNCKLLQLIFVFIWVEKPCEIGCQKWVEIGPKSFFGPRGEIQNRKEKKTGPDRYSVQ